MDFLSILILLSFILSTLLFLLLGPNLFGPKSKLPPGPTPLPILGNIHLLGRNPHRSLAKLSRTYGPLMHLRLGSITTIVASSPEIAREILQKHDQTCSSRAVPCVAHAMGHAEASMAWLPVGSQWRKLRKITKEHMFTAQKVNASEPLRQEKLRQLRDYLVEGRGREVNFEEVAFVTALNLISTTLFSVDFASLDSHSSHEEVKEIIRGIMEITGTPNVADFFPILRLVDPQGLKRKANVYLGKMLDKFDEIISKRLEERDKSSDCLRKKDLLEVLLDLNQEDEAYLSIHEIKHLLSDLIIAGADTTTDSVQWAMSELIRNPEKLTKAKKELRSVIGEKAQVQENDIPKLPYLNAVIKESFRLHPPGPFLIPHEAEADLEINGYTIPRGARILVNVWAIGRDPSVWSNPESFEPERFVGGSVDYKGRDFGLIPFGSGRRICPGLPLAHLMVHLMVASMIHEFDWEAQDVDMDDVFGLSLHKARPLKAFPIIKS
ncbi:cytochrome P450 76T24-like [Salvia hispanica]|uniref:cytochrome P450 76T24-like n=1 Tax=Salvia hispanica TaxID=49212 RepID=UPI002009554D|nr:cytochrome P450 76T24-like [Salvia hispanica]